MAAVPVSEAVLRVDGLEPGLVLADRELLVLVHGVDVGALLHLRLVELELFNGNGHKANPVAGAKQADRIPEYREALLRIPDRDRGAGEDLVAARRRHRVDRGRGAAHADR